ncbi:MAG: DUF1761 domain-containing protein [Cyclobacteriaceae bacterium]|nr:DUF1761 domain-containing protein [Cyclobacteriaceae bacterium]
MEEMPISMTAILVTVVATFVFGFIWYTLLFGKAWATEMKFDMTVKPPASAMIKGLAFMLVGNFFMAFVFASNNAAWSFVPGIDKMGMVESIANAAGFTWLGFFLPGDLSRVAWEQHSWKLFAINTSYHLLNLVIAAIILMNL